MSDSRREIREDVVKARIEVPNVVRIVIAQEMIELGQRLGNVLVPAAVDNVDPFVGVRVVQQKGMILGLV